MIIDEEVRSKKVDELLGLNIDELNEIAHKIGGHIDVDGDKPYWDSDEIYITFGELTRYDMDYTTCVYELATHMM